jgi:hypothetical protein
MEPAVAVRTRARIVAALVAVPLLVAAVVLTASEWVYHQPASGLVFGIRSESMLLTVLGALTVLVFTSTLVALGRGRTGLGTGVRSLVAMATLVAPICAVLVLPNPVHSLDAVPKWVDISALGMRCFVIASLVGAIVLAGFTAVLRRAVPVASRWRGAAIGAAAGAWASLAVFVFCPSGDRLHLLVGHVVPVVILVAVGSLTLARALRP